jgi:uncharacterized membrane protein
MSFEGILYEAHSGLRWLVVVVWVLAIAYLSINLFKGQPYEGNARRFMSAFSITLAIQWLLGLILIVILGVYTGYQLEHLVTMTLAVLLASLHRRFTQGAAVTARYRNALFILLGAGMLVFIGVARLPQGWLG